MNKKVSVTFLLLAILFTVCLIASNLFATKVFALGSLTLPGAVVIFPLSYILNDCFTEVWGYRKARLVIWSAFAMNFFVAITGQLVALLPGASFWDGAEHFNYVFSLAPKVAFASLLAFLAGSTLNSLVLSGEGILFQGYPFFIGRRTAGLAHFYADCILGDTVARTCDDDVRPGDIQGMLRNRHTPGHGLGCQGPQEERRY